MHRTPLSAAVLNNQWVSVPTGSEDFSFKNTRKNQFEEVMFKCEDDRFECDMIVDANHSAIRVLEPLAAEIRVLREKHADGRLKGGLQYRLDRRTLGIIHLKAISRVYGDYGNEVLAMLRKNPVGAIPIVLNRLKQKAVEWQKQRQYVMLR